VRTPVDVQHVLHDGAANPAPPLTEIAAASIIAQNVRNGEYGAERPGRDTAVAGVQHPATAGGS